MQSGQVLNSNSTVDFGGTGSCSIVVRKIWATASGSESIRPLRSAHDQGE